MTDLRETIKQGLIEHAKGHIEKHRINVEILMQKTAGVAEHPDTLDTIEKELRVIADYHDQLEVLEKYF
jgi:lipoate synthase